eukprot:Nk52_evm1s33 gene=Nk52_evmTU1s33
MIKATYGAATASKNKASDVGQTGQGISNSDVNSEGMKVTITSTLQPFVELVMTVYDRDILDKDASTRGNWAKSNTKEWKEIMHPLFYASCRTVIDAITHKVNSASTSITNMFKNFKGNIKPYFTAGVKMYESINKKLSEGERVNTKCEFHLIANGGSKGSLFTDASNKRTPCSCEWKEKDKHVLCVPPQKLFHRRIECTLHPVSPGVPYVTAICNRSTKYGKSPILNKKLACSGRPLAMPEGDKGKVAELSWKSRKWEAWENMRCTRSTSLGEERDFLSFAFTDIAFKAIEQQEKKHEI